MDYKIRYELCYRYCMDYILEQQEKTGWLDQLQRIDIIFILDEMAEGHGDNSILAMAGFIQWALNEDLDTRAIHSTLAHDLNGRKDKYMLPRTSDYLQYAPKIKITIGA
jgi:hypothetical protein